MGEGKRIFHATQMQVRRMDVHNVRHNRRFCRVQNGETMTQKQIKSWRIVFATAVAAFDMQKI